MGLDLRAKRTLAGVAVFGSIVFSAAFAVQQSRKLKKDLQEYRKPEVPEEKSGAISIKVDPYFCYEGVETDGGNTSVIDPLTKELASLKTAEGKYLFTCGDLAAFREAGGTGEYAAELASLPDGCGNVFFTAGYDIVAFKKSNGTVEYAKKFSSTACASELSFRGNQLPQLYSLGLDLKEVVGFVDTPKPDALVVYPTHDGIYNDENYGAFRTISSVNLFKELQKAYDIKVVIASTENEVYDALGSRAGFKLFMLCGHGTKTTLSLGEKDLRIAAAEKDETYRIDPSDSELELKLQNLDPAAVIFLNSCSTAEGGEKEDNLANTVAKWAKGRKTIAATEVLWTHRVTTNIPYPLEVTLMDKEGKKNITYVISVFNHFLQ